MTARFAGAQAVDERRRRRLATEQDSAPEPPSTANPTRTSGDALAGLPEETVLPTHFPIAAWVPRSAWKASGVAAALLVVTGIASATEWFVGSVTKSAIDPLTPLLSRTASSAAFLWECALLGVCVGLCGLVGWARAQSLRDFAGRYRVWPVIGSVFGIALALHLTSATELIERVAALTPYIASDRAARLAWLVPASWIGLTVCVMLHTELRASRAALPLLWCGVWCAALGTGWRLLAASPTDLLWQTGMLRASLWLLATALLFQTRYVLHVTPEPFVPVRKPKQERKSAKEPHSESNAETIPESNRAKQRREADANETAEPKPTPKKTPRKKTTPKKSSAPKPSRRTLEAAAAKQAETKPEPQAEETPTPEPTTPAKKRNLRVDRPDPSMLKGLSKREQRKVRKEWREQQRAAASGGEGRE